MGNTKQNVEDMVGAYPVCAHCQKTSVVRDAWATWNIGTGEWLLVRGVNDDCAAAGPWDTGGGEGRVNEICP